MKPPEARLRLGACDVLVLGTIAGFVPDGARVDEAFARHRPDHVALAVPEEDLAALAALAAAPDPRAIIGPNQPAPGPKKRRFTDPGIGAAGLDHLPRPKQGEMPLADATPDAPMAGLDAVSVRFLELLSRFGATRIPSPDLETAHKLAGLAGIPIAAIDLDDEAHSDAYTKRMKVRHLMRSGRRERSILAKTFDAAGDAYALANLWDAEQTRLRPLAAVERLREAHMGSRLRQLSSTSSRLLAIVPAPRMAGAVAAVEQTI